ncbi:cytochrome P450 [Streptomyces sp. NPDC006617]|uniref:cytochrome P450 n=1 Tax=Streptomyces sp. NPDC006617 TaxID=3155354 RepID=UPI0033A8B9FD
MSESVASDAAEASAAAFPFPVGPDRYPFPDGPMGRPSPEFARRRKECPVSEVTLPLGDKVLLVVTHADIHAIMSDDRRFVRDLSKPGTPKLFPNMEVLEDPTLVMNMDGEDHLRLRRIVNPTMTPRRVEGWRTELREIVDGVIDEIEAKGSPADLMTDYANKLPVKFILRQFGLPDSDADRLTRWVGTWVSVAEKEELTTVGAEYSAWVAQTVERSRSNPGTALVDVLVNAHDEGDRMSNAELESMIRSMVVAGLESIGNGISRALFTLLSEYECWEKLVADRSVLRDSIEELLRVNLPGGGSVGILRMAAEDVELPSGTLVRKGQWVSTPQVGAAQDPIAFPEPERFKPDRPKSTPAMVFGAGRHYCPAAHLAKAEIEIALSALMDRFPKLHMTVRPEELPWDHTHFNVGMPCLPVAW